MPPSPEPANSVLPPIPANASARRGFTARAASDSALDALFATFQQSRPVRASTLPWWIRLHVNASTGSMVTVDNALRVQHVTPTLSYRERVLKTRQSIPPSADAMSDTTEMDAIAPHALHATQTRFKLPRVATTRSTTQRSASAMRASLGTERCASPLRQEDT